ncbi:helix-turn-helix transcriptional regulator [Pseudoroseomonas cervicalis]|uniref:helix-turn-helix domain-containing protein n=1 Tax=Teichococcus cervicalis TaxID=204525 RepID=UPI0027847DCA|nr:helix-turn-helix transcriptional regulator [Pseudoroseomonas cervicalis]MDQ1081426.1 putative transcriptional regulator [Pseudoroseomonas cervicalis]
MDLRTFLDQHSVGPTAFARQIGVGLSTLYRYMAKERIPRREVMLRITKATGGSVTSNDFFYAECVNGSPEPSLPPAQGRTE